MSVELRLARSRGFRNTFPHMEQHGDARASWSWPQNMAAYNFTGNPRGDNIYIKASVMSDRDVLFGYTPDRCYRVFNLIAC